TLDNTRRTSIELPDLRLSGIASEVETAKFDLTLALAQTESGLVGSLSYNRDLFEAVTIQRMVGHLERMLESVVNDSEQSLFTIPMLSEAERYQMLVGWNETGVEQSQWLSVSEQFENQAEQIPDAIALVFEDRSLTYRELQGRVDRLSWRLRGIGVGPEVL